jgi:hypothetical protein
MSKAGWRYWQPYPRSHGLACGTADARSPHGPNRDAYPDRVTERKQRTPKGAIIPVPTRADVMADLKKVVKAPPKPPVSDGPGGAEEQ